MSRQQLREGKHGIGVKDATLGMVTLYENRHTRRMLARMERRGTGVSISNPLPTEPSSSGGNAHKSRGRSDG